MAVATRQRHGTKKAAVFSILDQNPSISTEDALAELKRRKIELGAKPKQSFYGIKNQWKQQRPARKPGAGRRRRVKAVQEESAVDQQFELMVLRQENAKLKAALAIFMS